MQSNAILQYKQQSISTMSRGEQLVLLFDEVLKNLHYGSMLLKQQDFENSDKCTTKCKNIFQYLSSVLDHKYSISKELYDLYYFCNQQIIRAEIRRDAQLLDDLVPLVKEMRETWVQAEKLIHMKK
ncbi:flagellar export chaperone FliS [Clostridium minihomine]|uniref:flagellar export chaperone FliS n=1 Tax=Clostridium minihomine TaxID=2045012 RepID=UPI000C76B379|nr:flagellar export chaperone FliS [Clostridium minihomine]